MFLFIFATGKITKTPEKITSLFSHKILFSQNLLCFLPMYAFMSTSRKTVSTFHFRRCHPSMTYLHGFCSHAFPDIAGAFLLYIYMQNCKRSHHGHFNKIEPDVSSNPIMGNHFINQSFLRPPPYIPPDSPPLPYLFQKSLAFHHTTPLFSLGKNYTHP